MEVLVGIASMKSTQKFNWNKALYTNISKIINTFFLKAKVDLKKNLKPFQKILIS
jgi:hypothetical protein